MFNHLFVSFFAIKTVGKDILELKFVDNLFL